MLVTNKRFWLYILVIVANSKINSPESTKSSNLSGASGDGKLNRNGRIFIIGFGVFAGSSILVFIIYIVWHFVNLDRLYLNKELENEFRRKKKEDFSKEMLNLEFRQLYNLP